MEEMTTQNLEEQETTQETEQETTTQEQETQQEIEQEQETLSYSETIETLPDNSENIIHELFAELGVNLDYTPVNAYQCFTMSLQFLAALWFIWWFVKYLWSVLRSFLSPKGWV